MGRPVFIDTNVLVYRFDSRDTRKQHAATLLIDALAAAGIPAVISAQVVSEFAHVFAGKLAALSPAPLRAAVAALAAEFWYTPVMPETIGRAVSAADRFGFSYYDAQVWASARLSDALVLFSEDFTDGLVAEGVRFVNPFGLDFDLDGTVRELRHM